jgi:uncharacterized Zn ribbon protein
MEYSTDDIIGFEIYNSHLYAFRLHEYSDDHKTGWKTPLTYCPICGQNDTTTYSDGTMHLCKLCLSVWKHETCHCLDCGRPLYIENNDVVLWCEYCGQRWDIEVIKDAYNLGDEDSMVDFSTPRNNNR